MCDYCDCRSRPPLAQLGEDHAHIATTAGVIARALAAGEAASATGALRDLEALLARHSRLEEAGLYPELAAEGIATEALDEEHHVLDAVVADAIAGSAEAWQALPEAMARLRRHIEVEEYDLFPAAHQLLSDAAWDRIGEVHHLHHHCGEHADERAPDHGSPTAAGAAERDATT